jgi:hypothetical protein
MDLSDAQQLLEWNHDRKISGQIHSYNVAGVDVTNSKHMKQPNPYSTWIHEQKKAEETPVSITDEEAERIRLLFAKERAEVMRYMRQHG